VAGEAVSVTPGKTCLDPFPEIVAEVEQLAPWRAQQAEVAAAIDLAQDCAELGRQRQPERLDAWLARAATRALQAL
jgi:hypothetical protein